MNGHGLYTKIKFFILAWQFFTFYTPANAENVCLNIELNSDKKNQYSVSAFDSSQCPPRKVLCYRCKGNCKEQSRRECPLLYYDTCYEFKYNDGSMEKGCVREGNYESKWNQENKTHKGVRSSYKCKEHFCNNINDNGFKCFKCHGKIECDNPVEQTCSSDQDACIHLVFNNGINSKECINSENYQKLLDDNKNKNKGLDRFSYKCKESLCNDKNLKDDPKGRLFCYYCEDKCEQLEQIACTEKQDTCYAFYYKDGSAQKGCVSEDSYKDMYKEDNQLNDGLEEYSFKCKKKFCNV